MIPVLSFRNFRIADATFGNFFLADDGEKFIIGRAGDGTAVAVMIEGNFGKLRPFNFSSLELWTRQGVIVEPKFVVDPTSIARPDSVPPGSISLDQGTIHIAAFSGQSYQPVAICGEGELSGSNAVAFTKWAVVTKGADGEPVELFAFGTK